MPLKMAHVDLDVWSVAKFVLVHSASFVEQLFSQTQIPDEQRKNFSLCQYSEMQYTNRLYVRPRVYKYIVYTYTYSWPD